MESSALYVPLRVATSFAEAVRDRRDAQKWLRQHLHKGVTSMCQGGLVANGLSMVHPAARDSGTPFAWIILGELRSPVHAASSVGSREIPSSVLDFSPPERMSSWSRAISDSSSSFTLACNCASTLARASAASARIRASTSDRRYKMAMYSPAVAQGETESVSETSDPSFRRATTTANV
eukprot:scaffold23456_cov29-Tisochrysis_lutea.AAC.1